MDIRQFLPRKINRVLAVVKHKLLFDPDRILELERKVDILTDLIKVTHDISKVPEAKGLLRCFQMANAAFLKRVTDVLDENHIPYWLSFGTLLGAVRHGKSIPWDDDIDIGVLREDHNRLVEILEKKFVGDGNIMVVKSDTMRVMRLDIPCQVDIFAFDVYGVSEEDPEARRRVIESYKMCREKFVFDWSLLRRRERTIVNMTDDEVVAAAEKLSGSFEGPKRVLMLGPESVPPNSEAVLDYEWLFPLAKISYEGMQFAAPRNSELILQTWYGDYMDFPSSFHGHADIRSRFSTSEIVMLMAEWSRDCFGRVPSKE